MTPRLLRFVLTIAIALPSLTASLQAQARANTVSGGTRPARRACVQARCAYQSGRNDARVTIPAAWVASVRQLDTVLSPAPVIHWHTLVAPPQAVQDAATTQGSDGNIYVFGGWVGVPGRASYHELATTYIYHPQSGTWTTGAAMPVRRQGARAVTLPDGRIAVLGGGVNCATQPNFGPYCRFGSVYRRVDVYTPRTNSWASLAAMASPREDLAAALYHGRILAVGGSDGKTFVSSVEAYDPATNRWTTQASLPVAIDQASAATEASGAVDVIGGSVIANGGPSSAATLSAAVYRFDGRQWERALTLPQALNCPDTLVDPDGRLYVIGGYSDSVGGYIAQVSIYDPRTRTWSSATPLPTPSCNGTAILDPTGRIDLIANSGANSSPVYLTSDPVSALVSTPLPTPLSAAWEAPYDGFTVAPGDRVPLSAAFTRLNGSGAFPEGVQFTMRLPSGQWMAICTVSRGQAVISGQETFKRNGSVHTIEVATYTCPHDVTVPLHTPVGSAAVSFDAILSPGHQINAPAGIRYGQILTADVPAGGPIQTYDCLATYLNACPGVPVRVAISKGAPTSVTIAVATFCNRDHSVPARSCTDDNPNDYSATIWWDDAIDIRPRAEAALRAELQDPRNHHIVPNAPIIRIEPVPSTGGRLAVVATHLFQPMGNGPINYYVVIGKNSGGRLAVVTGHVDIDMGMPYDPRHYATGSRLGQKMTSFFAESDLESDILAVLPHENDPSFTAGFFNATSSGLDCSPRGYPCNFPFTDDSVWDLDLGDWTRGMYAQLEQSLMTALISGQADSAFCDALLEAIADTPGTASSNYLSLYTDLANRIAANSIAANTLVSCAGASTLTDITSRNQGLFGGAQGGEPKVYKIAIRYVIEHIGDYALASGKYELGSGHLAILQLAAKAMQANVDTGYDALGAIGSAIGLWSAIALPYPIDSLDPRKSEPTYVVQEWATNVGLIAGAISYALDSNTADTANRATIVRGLMAGAVVFAVPLAIAAAPEAITAGAAFFGATSLEAGAEATTAVELEVAADGVNIASAGKSEATPFVKQVCDKVATTVGFAGIFTPLISWLTVDPFGTIHTDTIQLFHDLDLILADQLVEDQDLVKIEGGKWTFATQKDIPSVERDLDPQTFHLSVHSPYEYYVSNREGGVATRDGKVVTPPITARDGVFALFSGAWHGWNS